MKILLFYFLIALFVLRGVILSPGTILGGDWSLPFTLSQMRFWFENGLYTWTSGAFFGTEQFLLHSLPFWSLIGVLAKLGIAGEIYIKFLLVSAFALPAFTMYLLGRFLGCSRKVAILGGILYITLPFFFNYAAIGWLLVLFSMGVLPLAVITFVKSIETKSISYSILTGFLYFLAMIQPQSLVWYPLAFFSFAFFLINDKKSFFVYLQSFLVIFFVFLGMSAFWGLPLFLGGGSSVLETKLGLSTVSLGTWARLSNLNILRGWGSMFNYQYETSYFEMLRPLSFVLPFLAYSSLVFLRKKKIIYSFVMLSFIPVILFSLGPNFIVRLPFSDLIRDIARFSVISSFSYVVLAMMVLNFMLRHKQRRLRILGIIFCVLLIINAHPFWKGELFGEQKEAQDIRLRTYQFPEENIFLEKFIAEENRDVKVLYLPLGGALNALDDKRFYGTYREMRDIFASYSPKQGEIGISDKGMGSPATDLIFKFKEIQDSRQFDDLSGLLSLTGVKYVAVRKNVDSSLNISGEEIASLLDKSADLSIKKDWGKISVFENNNFLPHFYIPQKIVYSDRGVESLVDIVGFGDYEIRSGIYLQSSKLYPEGIPRRRQAQSSKLEIDLADEVFVAGELKNSVTEENLGINLPIVSLPSVKNKPEGLMYRLVLLNENFDKWKVRKEPEKLIEKHLFYASKRIAEFEKFKINNINGLTDYLLTNYEKEMMEAIKETEKLGNKGIKRIEKLRAYLETHRRKIGQTNLDEEIKNKTRDVFDDLEGKITELEQERDFSRLDYKLDIPKEGEYEIYIKDINGLIDYKEIDGNKILDTRNSILDIGGTEPDIRNSILDIDGNWKPLEVKYFPEGEQEFVLPFSGISENLIDENLRIRNYQPDAVYRISFDYKAPKGGGFFVAEGKGGETARTDLSSTGEKLKRFGKFFKSSSGVADASVHLSISVAEEKNLKVERVYQPEIMLRSIDNQSPITNHQLPKITFVKINPTKYRIKVEGARESYTLVFSESFHQGWKAYVSDQRSVTRDQYGEIVASYFNGDIKEGTHQNIFLDRNTFETLGKKPLPEERHLLINGYANSWYITPEDSAGKQDYEIVIEFQPQRLFYLGLGISIITLLGCLGWVAYGVKKIKIKKNG